jgi:flagellar motor switch/type III secretory pathway protein FliN
MEIRRSRIDSNQLQSLPIQVSVRVCGKIFKLKQMLEWHSGTILKFDQPASTTLALYVGSQQMGEGLAVKVKSAIGVKLSQIKRR